jgi:hypothetical protein
MSCDAQNAFLFQCGDEQLFAVSLDNTGVNLPRNTCTQGWLLREKVLLGVQEPVPAAISPDPILSGIDAKGYHIWRSGNANKPTFPLKTRPTSNDRDRVAGQLRTSLQNMAAAGLTITYGGLAKLLGLSPADHSLPRSYSVRLGAGCRQRDSLTAHGGSAGSPVIPMELRLDLSTQPS